MAVSALEKKAEIAAELLGSFTLFVQFFFPLVEGRSFEEPRPFSREPHTRVIARALTRVYRADYAHNLYVMLPPRHFKSTMCCYFIAWTMAAYPDSRNLYISYGAELASEKTETILKIMSTYEYGDLFGVYINPKKRARDNFATTKGGTVKARGLNGQITGSDAGLPFEPRWTGCVIIDDAHKPDEVFSDTIREFVIKNYQQTVRGRSSSPRVPIIFLGHALHEEDLGQYIKNGHDILDWEGIILPALDDVGNALAPEVLTAERLNKMKAEAPYVFWSQYQQKPTPAGGALFKEDWMVLLDKEPEMLATFITIDCAETDKTYNDATVLSFFGVYHLPDGSDALHSINTWEIRVEAADLEAKFWDFYDTCLRYPKKPDFVLIEEESNGVFLSSILKRVRGIQIRTVKRKRSKAQRFLDCEPFFGQRRISFPRYSNHTALCITHLTKISPAMSHAHDDIADTFADAIDITFISQSAYRKLSKKHSDVTKALVGDLHRRNSLINQRYSNGIR